LEERRSLEGLPSIGGQQTWGEDEWPPERTTEYYDPATWAQDRSWGYRTPICMLNHIIRLQAVVEIITNQTVEALKLVARQLTQSRAAIYQNRLALDYLRAEEGGFCGKFNTSECCLEIDDNGEAIAKIADEIKRIAHVPVQKWNSILSDNWWDNLCNGAWWKKLGFVLLCSVMGLLFLPCMIPCFIRLIHSIVQRMQISAVPMDPEMFQRGKTHSLMIIKIKNRSPLRFNEL